MALPPQPLIFLVACTRCARTFVRPRNYPIGAQARQCAGPLTFPKAFLIAATVTTYRKVGRFSGNYSMKLRSSLPRHLRRRGTWWRSRVDCSSPYRLRHIGGVGHRPVPAATVNPLCCKLGIGFLYVSLHARLSIARERGFRGAARNYQVGAHADRIPA